MTSDERYNLVKALFNNSPENIELVKNYEPDTVHEAVLLDMVLNGGIDGGASLPVVLGSNRYTNEQIDTLLTSFVVPTPIGFLPKQV